MAQLAAEAEVMMAVEAAAVKAVAVAKGVAAGGGRGQ